MKPSEHIEGIKQTGGNITAMNLAAGRNATIHITSGVMESSAPDEVKTLFKTLVDQIEVAKPNIESSKIKQLEKNLKTLGNEVAEEEPNREWYQLSLNGLTEAAKALGVIGKPIVQTVATLMKLLLP